MRLSMKFAVAFACAVAAIGLAKVSAVSAITNRGETARSIVWQVQAGPAAFAPRQLYANTQYIGAVTTFKGFHGNFVTAATYDTDDKLYYIVDGYQLEQLRPDGAVKVVANLSSSGYGLVWDHATQLFYVSVPQFYEILSVSPLGVVNLLAGGHIGTSDGMGSSAQFQFPTGVALDTVNDVLYVADSDRLRRVGVNGSVVTVGGAGMLSQGNAPGYGLAYDTNSAEVGITNYQPDAIGAFSTLTGTYRLIAGRCVSPFGQFGLCAQLQMDGHGANAYFAQPQGIAYSGVTGDYYVADTDNTQVRRVSPSGDVTTIAGNGGEGPRDGVGDAAEFEDPTCTALDTDINSLLVCDTGGTTLRNVTTTGQLPPPIPHSFAMALTPTPVSGPTSIVQAPDGSLWFAEGTAGYLGQRLQNGKIRQYALSGGFVDPSDTIIGVDGDIEFLDWSGFNAYGNPIQSYIATKMPGGQIKETLYPNHCGNTNYDYPENLTAGPAGTTWFAGTCPTSLGFLAPNGTYFDTPTQQISGIAIGHGAFVWAGTPEGLLKYTTSGSYVATYANVSADSGVAIGADGYIWFANSYLSEIGAFNPTTKAVVTYSLPACGCNSRDLGNFKTGPNGDLWFTEGYTLFDGYPTAIGRMTESGVYTEFPIFEPHSIPSGIAFGPDGTLWISDVGAEKIGHMR